MRKNHGIARFGARGHELIKQTPFSLLALTRHPIEPHEEDWFARCRADYLRSFPLSLLELVRLVTLLSLVGPFSNLAYSGVTLAGWALVMAAQASVRRKEAVPSLSQKEALRYRRGTIRIRSIWWCIMLAWGIIVAPQSHHAYLATLGAVMMMIDGISVVTLPHLALGASIAGGCATVFGIIASDGIAAAVPLAVELLILASFLHWSIYNLYYLFATRRIRTRRLSESHETVQLLLNQYDDEGSDWLYEVDSEGRIQRPSPRFCRACALNADELEGMPLTALFHEGQHRQELQERLASGKPFRNVVIPLTINGEEHWWHVGGRPVDGRDGEQGGWRGFIADISATKQAEAKVAFLAHYDLLTSLPNRTLFTATLERYMSRQTPQCRVGLLFVDLDHFKDINDGYGHDAGDKVLAEVARRLENAVRPGDMVARLGGDEFAVILPDLPSHEVGIAVATRILKELNEPVEIDSQLRPLGASIGAAFAPDHGKTGDELLRSADLAMYDAKVRGRKGISVFEINMLEVMEERRELGLGLRAAIVRGELELYYQSIVDISTGKTTGYEALLRWHHPSRGLIPPAEFIPIAEETGIIVEIGEWVIRNALADAAHLPDHLTVAINVSPAQMRDERLVPLVVNALAASGVAPRRLELEITETIFIKNTEHVLGLLHKLRSIGVRISLDDFGTGYSSLTYLHRFPFDKIKIDQSFVKELVEREDCQAIVQSVISLANDLKMVTTAEGVETSGQLNALRERGCTQVQGFLFSRAVPSEQLRFSFVQHGRNLSDELTSVTELTVHNTLKSVSSEPGSNDEGGLAKRARSAPASRTARQR